VIQKFKYFFEKGIWLKELEDLPKSKSFLIRQVRVIVMALKGFNEDRCVLRASALTYYSLLSFVPVIAMAFGIAKGFGMEQAIDELVQEGLGAHQEITQNVIEFSHRMLENTKGGLIAGVGVAVLFWSVIKVLGNIERSFNAIWGITKDRTLLKKFTEYLAIMALGPVLLIVANSASVLVSSSVINVVKQLGIEQVNDSAQFVLKLVPYITMWLLLTVVYMVMPNTKVNGKSAFFAAVVAGTIFQLVQWVYVYFQIGVAGYNAIYGSFAAIPLFLAWLQLSWLIILFGAELSFAHQNVGQYRLEEESTNISSSYRKRLTLYVLHFIIKRFASVSAAPNFDTILKETKLPYRLLQLILEILERTNIISVLKSEEDKVWRYQPAVDTDLLTIDYVLIAIENIGIDEEFNISQPQFLSSLDKLIQTNKDTLIKQID